MRRFVTVALVVLGIAMIAAPLALSMFGRSSDGEAMVDDLRPIMQPGSVEKTVAYYHLFEGLRDGFGPVMTPENVETFQGYLEGLGAMQKEFPRMLSAMAQQLGMSDRELQAFLEQRFPAVADGLEAFPQMGRDFSGMVGVMSQSVEPFQQVPAALTHYGDLVERMERNVGNYQSVDDLPAMSLFPWFFIVPGVILLVLATLLAVGGRGQETAPAAPRATVPAV